MARGNNRPRNLKTTSERAAKEAREQARAYDSLFTDHELEVENGESIIIPPHPDFGMLDDDRMSEYEDLLFERDETYDREPDVVIPEQHLRDPDTGELNGVVIPGDTQRGALKRPYRVTVEEDGQKKTRLVKPPWSVKVAKVALGDDEYDRLRKAGYSAADVWKIWTKQGMLARQRQAGDPKSDGGSLDLAPVSETDSE